MSSFTNQNRSKIPETKVGAEGSAKRNITRKKTGGGGGSKIKKGNLIDDGSLYTDPSALDEYDPNYDSEEETGREFIPGSSPDRCDYVPELRTSVKTAKMTLSEYKKLIEKAIEEYFASSDINEIQRAVLELDCPEYSYELVKRAISMSLDRTDREREQISQLISSCYPDILSTNMIGKGFERLFELVDELVKDVPSAREKLTTYLARCVVDEVLPPSFLSDIVVRNLGGEIVEHAKRLLSREHASAMLERAWGPGDGRPAQDLKVAVDLLIQEYILSDDLDEACRCIIELNSNYFHHEIVKRGISVTLDNTPEKRLHMSQLFSILVKNEIMSREQATLGFTRALESSADFSLDIPNAKILIDEFIQRAITDGVLDSKFGTSVNETTQG
mmetsp:Transcript_5543/g.5702  ORF Transcript_5543/g.5702 Transcript_5543/m.5702 type:complete len:389 (+) Transcript_5543:1612-2778(+)|eukprot:CAMPEP_0174818226 /NCGR_PEP_ID=MMETSP1107-20130205/866_1 /TAXON_ID=36770 /ORGANISM="Paraphysomonas vestita, Strain GFlagA" /LENGTH=388 /DNA_ID=CAMNT_0016029785 /DNA_START=149 /DNA_END=1315 /DNA_ORIENTATION=-